jgi:circadian clock protein KaiB
MPVKTNKTRRPTKTTVKSLAPRPPGLRRAEVASATQAGKYVLRLFVAGATARSREAVLRVQQLCKAELKDSCKLEVIDIYQQPKLARKNQIVATPTLIIEFPKPVRRFIGSLTNITGLFVELDLITKGKIAI